MQLISRVQKLFIYCGESSLGEIRSETKAETKPTNSIEHRQSRLARCSQPIEFTMEDENERISVFNDVLVSCRKDMIEVVVFWLNSHHEKHFY